MPYPLRTPAYAPGVPELLLVSTTAGLDYRDLVRAIERQVPEGVSVRSAPGLLAPLREGSGLVREAARERGAIVVVVAPGGPDLANHALLTVEAARAIGLPVAAVVVAGPGGADQREALREGSGAAAVMELADPQAPSSVVATWPLSEWAAAEPAPAGGGGAGDVALAPYSAWDAHTVPDPRTAGRGAIDPDLAEIVAAEGPVLASRAFGLYNRAAGGRKLTTIVRAPLSSAAYRLRMAGRIEIVTAEHTAQGEDVLRPAGSPPVRVRELGPRTLDEVPLDEVAELMHRLTTAGATDLKRAVLDAYGLVRLTAKADEYLERALDLAQET
ncbi:MAG: hypothetical protein QOH46_1081 [Solirubrobacteraceae bacterium]|nr:hypothetical protein [Solirubrobacteraceae bacterium]